MGQYYPNIPSPDTTAITGGGSSTHAISKMVLLVTVLDGAQQLTIVNKNCILDDPAGVFIPSVLQY